MFSTVIPFVIFLFFWNVSPGPMTTLVSRNSVKFSYKGGVSLLCGFLICDAIYLAFAFAGASQFIMKHEMVFHYAKILGGCYIFYIGASILWHSRIKNDYTSGAGVSKTFNFKKEIVKGFFTDLSNPFTIVGMTSFILPFFKPDLPLSSTIVLALCIPICTIFSFLSITFAFGNPIIRKIILPKIVWFERLAGVVIALMAINIIFF